MTTLDRMKAQLRDIIPPVHPGWQPDPASRVIVEFLCAEIDRLQAQHEEHRHNHRLDGITGKPVGAK